MLGRRVRPDDAAARRALYGVEDHYATHKRAMGKKQLRRLGLRGGTP